MTDVESYETHYGFVMGAAEVTRMATFGDGTACIRIQGKGNAAVDVYVSPGGRSVRVFGQGSKRGEWKPVPAAGAADTEEPTRETA